MAYVSKQFIDPVILPDGTKAYSVAEVEKRLKLMGLAMQSDYSKQYLQNKRFQNERAFKKDMFDSFLTNYKRMIFK